MTLLYISLGISTFISLLSFVVAKSIFKPKVFEYEHTKEIEVNKGFASIKQLANPNNADVYVMHGNLKLHAHYINNNSNKTIIIMHGYTYTLFGSYKYAQLFLDKNYNVLLPDQRFHGLSGGKCSTLGYKEHQDLSVWIDYINNINPNNEILGLHGESMGGATVLLEGHNKDIDFVIADCSFSTLKKQTQDVIKKLHIPTWIIYPSDLFSRLIYKTSILRTNPINNIKNITCPILMIHGDADTYIPIYHFDLMRNKLKKTDSVYICKGAEHAMSYETNPEIYNNKIEAFLSKSNI